MNSTNSFSKLSNIVLILSLIGVVFSSILVFHHTEIVNKLNSGPSSCVINETINCDKVAESKYSEIAGIPVASFALLFYLTMIGTVVISKWGQISSSQKLSSFYFLSATLSLVPTLMLLFVSVVHIKAVCLYCLVLQLVNITFFIVCLFSKAVEKNLGNGFSAITYFLSNNSPDLALRRTALSFFVITAIAVYFAPGFLRAEIIEPMYIARMKENASAQSAQATRAEVEKTALKNWQELAPVDLGVDTTSDLENRDFALGVDSAKIRIITFSDFECPHCQKIAQIFHELYKQYSNKVQIVFKNYPLDKYCNTAMRSDGHKYACKAAIAARCAGREGDKLFWQAHDLLFSATIDQNVIDAIPGKLGLDQAKYEQCLSEPKSLERLLVDVSKGQELQLQGTPSIFVNNRKVPDPTTLSVIINSLLAEK